MLAGALLAVGALAVLIRLGTVSEPEDVPDTRHVAAYIPSAATGIEPILRVEDLAAAGISVTTRHRITHQVAALNTLLMRLAVVHRDYHASSSTGERNAIEAHARTLHLAVDRAENALHHELSPRELEWFHAYFWPRIATAGLPHEREHHERGGIRSGVVRGFDHQAETE